MDETTTPGDKGSSQGESKVEQADRLIRNHVIAVTAAVGLIPIPLVDVPIVAATQINLVRSLASLYEAKFSEELARSALAALLASSAPLFTGNLLKMVFPPAGMVGAAGSAAAATYTIGKIFVQHFESGGSFLTFDPKKVREHFARELEKSREGASQAGGAPDREDYGGVMP